MTTEVATRTETGGITSAKPPAPLPNALVREVKIQGYSPIWVPLDIDDAERIAIQQSLIDIELRLVPASQQERVAAVTEMAEYYGSAKSDPSITTWLELTAEDLKGFSLPHIQAAFREHRQSSNYRPKSAELRKLAVGRQSTALVMCHRARVLLGLDAPKGWETKMLDLWRSQRAQEEADAQVPNLEQRLDNLPPALASTARKLVKAAQINSERRSA